MKMIWGLGIPILTDKLPVGEFESFIFIEMSIWERKRFLVPSRISGLIPGS